MEEVLQIPGRVRTALRFIMGVKSLWGEIEHKDAYLHHSLFLEHLK